MPTPASSPIAFRHFLNHAQMAPAQEPTPDEKLKQAHSAAAGLVSNALILPILKQLRHSPWGKNTLFSGGTGEKTFGPQFDMQIADRIAQSPQMSATTVLTQKLMQRGQRLSRPKDSDASRGLNING